MIMKLTELSARTTRLALLCVLFSLFLAFEDTTGALAATQCLSECTQRIGIVSAFGAEADILLEQTKGKRDWVINGNRFTTGELRGNKVVIVLSGVGIVNATMITQVMLDNFRIERLLFTGIAGGVNPARHVGDVLVPERWVMSTEVYWNGNGSVPAACGSVGDVSCLGLKLAKDKKGDVFPGYRMRTASGPVDTGLFLRENFLMNKDNTPRGEYRFDYVADPEMLAVARTLKPQLATCGPKNRKLCISTTPVLSVGGRAASGAAFLANPDYRDYLFAILQAESIDMETAAFAHVATANKVPFLAFRSLSDLAGGNDYKDVAAFFGSGLAETNEAAVTLDFLKAWKNAR